MNSFVIDFFQSYGFFNKNANRSRKGWFDLVLGLFLKGKGERVKVKGGAGFNRD
jgi:hypothetical protein